MSPPTEASGRLQLERPKDWATRLSLLTLFALAVGSWIIGDFGVGTMLSERRMTNLRNFVSELKPYPLQSAPFDWQVLKEWLVTLMREKGLVAMVTTLAISLAAIFLAGCGGVILSILAGRTLAAPSPFLPDLQKVSWPLRICWQSVASGCRLLMIFVRAIPEYIWAFLFLALLGPVVWPLVLALAKRTRA